MLDGHNYHHVFTKLILVLNPPIPAMAGGLGVLYGKDPLNLPIEDQISFAAQVVIIKMIILMMQPLPSLMMVVILSPRSSYIKWKSFSLIFIH